MLSITAPKIKRSLLTCVFIFFSFITFSFFIDIGEVEAACSVSSAKFTKKNEKDEFKTSGNQVEDWFDDENPPEVRLDVQFAGDCEGMVSEVSIVESDLLLNDSVDGFFSKKISGDTQIDDKKIRIPSSNSFYMFLRVGETNCEFGGSPDCQYFVQVSLPGNTFSWDSDEETGGNLNYDCDGVCDENWILEDKNIFLPEGVAAKNIPTETTYKLLAPIPGLPEVIETSAENNPCAFGKYLNIMLKVVLGIAAVLALIMIVQGGLQYMTTGLISSKEAGTETIQNALLGLVIALGAVLILNTVNPKVLNFCLDNLEKATITIVSGPDTGDSTADPDFGTGKERYSAGVTSTEIASAVNKLKDGWKISKMMLNSSNRIMTIEINKGSETSSHFVLTAPGLNGFATSGTARVGDKKTPIGDWKIIKIEYTPGKPQYNTSKSNMGAAFWRLNPMTNGERGIGIHGNKNGTLDVTNGCIRLKNADILALQPYIYEGLPVIIQ